MIAWLRDLHFFLLMLIFLLNPNFQYIKIQVCLWCFYNIRDNVNGLCPACRTPYEEGITESSTEEKYVHCRNSKPEFNICLCRYRQINWQLLIKTQKNLLNFYQYFVLFYCRAANEPSHNREKGEKRREPIFRKNLYNVRVVQRNLLYVIGIPKLYADEEVIKL